MRLPTSAALLVSLLAAIPFARAAEEATAGNPFDVNAALGQRWKEKLGFTDGQTQKYSTAEKRKEDALRPLRARQRAALQKVESLVAAKADDDNIAVALDELAEAKNAIADADARFDAALASFLSPTQRAMMLIGMPLGGLKTDGAADKRTSDMHAALTDSDLEQE